MISADRRWIFVHIQRTGGNTVRSALGVEPNDAHKHFLARELKPVYGEAAWTAGFKFAFVRNPWDRLVSWWSLIDNGRDSPGVSPPPNNFFGYVLRQANSFEQFVSCCTDEIVDRDGRKHIFRNQIDYLVDADAAVMVDFIGRFERLQEDFDKVAARLGLGRIASTPRGTPTMPTTTRRQWPRQSAVTMRGTSKPSATGSASRVRARRHATSRIA
jgi:hypothetical protein